MQFEQELTRYTSILAPVARAIKALESTDTTASDVLLFWLATASHLNHLLSQSENVTGISPKLQQKVRGIVNARYKAFIDEAPNDIYFNTFYLDPRESFGSAKYWYGHATDRLGSLYQNGHHQTS